MTLYEYKILSGDEQYDTVFFKGDKSMRIDVQL